MRVEARPNVFFGGIFDESFSYVIPHDRSSVPPPPPVPCKERRAWAWQNDGADAGETWAEMTLASNRSAEVTIAELHVEIVKKTPLSVGFIAECTTGGADPDKELGLQIDLDRSTPKIEFISGYGGDAKEVPRWKLKPGAQDTFNLLARVRLGFLVEWRLVATVISDGKTEQLIVDDRGAPFRTAGATLPRYSDD